MKIKNVIFTCTGIFAALVMFAGCGSKTGEKEYAKAMSAWENGDLVRARSLLEKSINRTSENEKKSAALNELGLVLWELGEADAAAEAFSQSVNLTETLSGANLNLGIALYHSDQLDDAEVALQNVLGAEPKNETALAILGMIELRKRNWAGATKELTKSATLNPQDPATQNALALAILHQTKDSNRAIARLKQVTAAYPDYAPALYNLASIYEWYAKNTTAAMTYYKQYLAKAGSDGSHTPAANNAIARLGGKPVTSPANSNTATRVNPAEAARYIAEGSRLHSQKKYDEAIAQYKKAVMADPKQKSAYYNMGLAFYAKGDFGNAATACNNAVNLDPAFSDARYMLSLAYAKQKKWNDAEREAKELVSSDPAKGEQMLKYISDARKR
ncbi:tetratricopeptide repeat protein [Pontiella agarivorans]|uniref:Tetratricopeptide repeat protein n=1 Tax=Pontiella agarivorans TaxID=3038953 RepID=A0ABU5MSC3_9BACT|nr:tetratricopeptide repeat protein [Pontiella agarivorans]MDZ8117102.1 tetratricopeptide repeat protein [Pontiella agarivorans]